MNTTLNKAKEKEILQYITGLLLQSEIPAIYIGLGNNSERELVQAIYLKQDNCQRINSSYYFKDCEDSNSRILVCERNIVPDVRTIDDKIDINIILEIMDAYNYIASDGTFVLENDVINYRSFIVINDDTPDEVVRYQLKKMISNEIAVSEKVRNIIPEDYRRVFAA